MLPPSSKLKSKPSKMEARGSSKTLFDFQQTAWLFIKEGRTHEAFKLYFVMMVFNLDYLK
jgi:hypothetical protein